MVNEKLLYTDNTIRTGLITLSLSLIIFLVYEFWDISGNGEENYIFSFFCCFVLFIFYAIYLNFQLDLKTGNGIRFSRFKNNIILLLLGNVSAYSLNRFIPVFHESTTWLTVYLVLLNLALLNFVLRKDKAPDALNHLAVAVVASGVLFSFYQSIYVFPLYPMTFFSFWFFGISLHTFIPIWFLFVTIMVLRRYYGKSNLYQYAIITGLALPSVILMGLTYHFYQINKDFQSAYNQLDAPLTQPTELGTDLPAWVMASKNIPTGWMTERVLKSKIYYTIIDRRNFFSARMRGLNRLGVSRHHDPIIVIGALVSGDLEISDQERLKLLNAMYNKRHDTQRRLWRGDDLSTNTIETNVKLYPAHRMAYTEKTITIKNHNHWKGSQQEATYSFYLPEGSVVTSASLWVEGEERESILTTRGKADSAYVTIVKRERRDPLLVHWQEGNRISAQIFPCTPAENRQFKIGITSPLQIEDGRLQYDNIDFEGPDWQMAKETIRINAGQWPDDFNAALGFSESNGQWQYSGRYRSDWALDFIAPPLDETPFYFNGQAIKLVNYQPTVAVFKPKKIYLDLHRGWSASAVKDILKMTADREVYVFTNQLQRLTSGNQKQLLNSLLKTNYSLFPFYQLTDTEDVLVITHDGQLTPTLDDLEKTPFAEKLRTYLANREKQIPVFNIGSTPSPYLKTLKEMRSFNFQNGTTPQLADWLAKDQFPNDGENENTVLLSTAQVQLEATPTIAEVTNTAPDHLFRLFTYNDVMRKIGADYFRKNQQQQDLVEAAELAYVVTPISSLITLETQADYDRFDIKKSEKSLGNADLGGGGAVPEPHEWLLIIFGLLLAGWLWFVKR